ncbi:MAG: hypothetical protein NTX42_05725, partial [Methanothrix sp.]|nr:hypothetical protein [Methanothrix sp.]
MSLPWATLARVEIDGKSALDRRRPARARVRAQEAGRAKITFSREGAKPRSPDERRTILALIDFCLD